MIGNTTSENLPYSNTSSSSGLENVLTSISPVKDGSPSAFIPSASMSPGSASSRHGSSICWQGALHLAAQKGYDSILRVLLEHNTDSNERDSDGLTPLMHAIIGGHDDVAVSLLSHGACIGDLDGHGRSALHWAVLHRREALLKLLLARSVNTVVEHGGFVDAYDNTWEEHRYMAQSTRDLKRA